MYLICKVASTALLKHGLVADVTPIAFAYDKETAQQYAEEHYGFAIVLDTNFKITLEDAIYQTKRYN